MARQDQANGFDVQVGTGANKKFYRVFVLFTKFKADSPQMHSLTGVSNKACHLCMSRNFANFRINDSDANGRNGSICELSERRIIVNQYNAGIRHVKAMSDFINKIDGSTSREARRARKQTVVDLKKVQGYSGINKAFSVFKTLIFSGNCVFFIAIILS